MKTSPAGRRLLFLSLLPFYPDVAGGAEWTHLRLFQSLRQRGWRVRILCGTTPRSRHFRRLLREAGRALMHFRRPPAYVADEDAGYPAWRGLHCGWHPGQLARRARSIARVRLSGKRRDSRFGRGLTAEACNDGLQGARRQLDETLDSFRPDVVLGHYGVSPLLHHAALRGYPSFYFSRRTRPLPAGLTYPRHVHIIANSPATADLLAAHSPHEVGLVLSLIDPDRYRVEPGGERFITLANAIPSKGLDVAVEVARRLPEERFLFIRGGWFGIGEGPRTWHLLRQARRLGNVTIREFQNDMRAVYRATDILLVPSRRECFGRVILEAQLSGIPVVAAQVGGIAHTLGRGGILVDPVAGPAGYVQALQQIRRDRSVWEELSARALENSRRQEFDPEFQVDRFIEFIETRDRSGKDADGPVATPAISSDQGGRR